MIILLQRGKLWHYFFNIETEFTKVKKIVFFLFLSVIYVNAAFAQGRRTDEIIQALRKGNAEELAVFFNTNVDLTLLDEDNGYSKVQATMVMKDFFIRYVPDQVTLKHSGSQKDGSCYAILSYRSTNKDNLRVVFYLKPYRGILLINELRFDLTH